MKWIIKAKSLSDLIIFIQKNLKSENYIFITTHEIFSGQKDNFEIFCKKIPLNYVVECFIEKTEKSFKSGMVIFKIKKEYILEKELAFFELVKEENNPTNLIPIRNNFDYEYSKHNTSNQNEIGWFLRKIFGSKAKMQDHYAVKTKISKINQITVREVVEAISKVEYSPPILTNRPSSDFFYNQYLYYFSKHEIEKSKSSISISIKLDPTNFLSYHELGNFHYQNASFVRAMECFKISQKINPYFSYNKKMISKCYFALGKTSLAISEMDQINLEKQPDAERLDLKMHLATFKTFTQDYNEAITVFQELHYEYKNASQTWPDFIPSLFVNWIYCLKKDNRIDDQIRVFKLALNEIPSSYHQTTTYGMFVHDLALLFIEFDQIDNAIDVCKDGLSKSKANWPVWQILALCQIKKNEPDNSLSSLRLAKSFLEKEPPANANYFLKELNNFIETITIGLDEIKSKEITEALIKNSPSIIESTWELKLKEMGAVALTSSKENNDQIAITKLNECKGYLFWVDPYFESPGFKWISEAYIKKNSPIRTIEILAKFNQHSPQEDLYTTEFKKLFNELKSQLNEKNISLELRICFESKYARDIHARYWYFYENQPPSIQSAWSIPSIMNFKRGQKESINPTPFRKDNFDEIWNYSLNFEKDYDKIILKYQEWRKK